MGENMNTPRIIYENDKFAMMEVVPFKDMEPAGELPEEVEPLPSVPESVEQTLTIPPEWIAFVEATAKACGEFCKAMGILADWLGKWKEETYKELNKIAFTNTDFLDLELSAVCDNPRWWHLYKHAKKYRVRKKYRNRLMKQLLSKLRAANAQEA